MLLDVDVAVFDAPDHGPVIDLITLIAKERHDWHPSLPEALRADKFVRKLHAAELKVPALAEWSRKAVEEAAHPRPTGRTPVRLAAAELDRIVPDLAKAAIVVVENRLGDGDFVRRVATAFGEQRIVDALARDWLRFSHGGGCGQMPALAAEERKRFNVLVRVAVLFDSDRTRYGQPSPHERRVQECRVAGVPEVHVFACRMMENYVPFRVWDEQFPLDAATIARLRAMPPRQRGYVHLKHEFVQSGRMPSPLIPDTIDLTEADFEELGDETVPDLRALLAMIHRIL
jgi:hypothetical protein